MAWLSGKAAECEDRVPRFESVRGKLVVLGVRSVSFLAIGADYVGPNNVHSILSLVHKSDIYR